MLATTLVALAGSVPAAPFAGKFVAGVGDAEFLRLVDIGRRQQSSAEIEFQSIMSEGKRLPLARVCCFHAPSRR